MNSVLLTMLLLSAPAPDAERLYQEGTTLYEAADYEGAVTKFQDALNLVGSAEEDTHTRMTLLFNIALAHERQYGVDEDVAHLRRALVLYERYLEYTRVREGLDEEQDDVASRLKELRRQLKALEKAPTPAPEKATEAPASEPEETKTRRAQESGIGLVAGGGVAVLGGVALAVAGSRLEPRARDQVNQLSDDGIPEDHSAWEEGAAFVAQQRRRGYALIGVGVALSVAGTAGIGAGSYLLVRARKAPRVSFAPTWSTRSVGVQLRGTF